MDFTKLACKTDDDVVFSIDVEAGADEVDELISSFRRVFAKSRGLDVEQPNWEESLDARYPGASLREQMRDYVLNRMTAEALDALQIESFATPGTLCETYPEAGEPFGFSIRVVTRPKLTLSSLEPVHIAPFEAEVEEADIQDQLDYVASQFARFVDSPDECVQDGDFVTADTDILVNKRQIEGLSGPQRVIEIRRGLIPDELYDMLIGMKVGDMRKTKFTLPAGRSSFGLVDKYRAEAAIHRIQRKETPVLDDAFIAEHLPEYGDLAGLRASIVADLEKYLQDVKEQRLVFDARNALAARLQGTIPDDLYEDAKESLYRNTVEHIEQEHGSLDAYLQEHGIEKDAFNMNIFMQASEILKQNLALDCLADGLELGVSDAEIADARREMGGALASLSDDEFETRGYKKKLASHLKRKKAADWLMDTLIEDG